jgi:hypothetical protein
MESKMTDVMYIGLTVTGPTDKISQFRETIRGRGEATNLDQIDIFRQRGITVKLISNERMKREKLEWGELIGPNEHAEFWHHEIVDSTGQVFIGVVYKNGAVGTAYTIWDSVETFERFETRPILRYYGEHVNITLHWNNHTHELFCERSHRNSCDTYIYPETASELLDLFLSASEDDLIELPETGHVCISLPAQLKQQIEEVAAAENQSLKDWVISRLSQSAKDERSRASLAQAADRGKRFREHIKRIKDGRALPVSN